MKKSVLLLVICLSISITSCGDKEKKANTDTNQTIEEPKQESVFKINLNIVIPNDDDIEIYYLDYNKQKYSNKARVIKTVKGDLKSQDIEILLPKEIFPTSLRFDFGKNNSLENVIFNGVTMTYEDFELKLNPQEFYSFFIPNNYIKYTKETGVIERKMVDGKYDPYFNSKPIFKKRLELEAR
ncbi:hypothetical protein FG167_05580 [Lacinutrix sp. WUR7]|uniref:hypothetical protein n=1 Tax=Lacinutrix sp. WUR7 TaxID=2653681 RepID=UPI00193D75CF|nr:hypothetical protein [Lacinutrix sp. WUR7]QRM88724.1 hypothetical protein FG167_05580 [Lacinutrix sp. WUR7]